MDRNDDPELMGRFLKGHHPRDKVVVEFYPFDDRYGVKVLRRGVIDMFFGDFPYNGTLLPSMASFECAFTHLPAINPIFRLRVDLRCKIWLFAGSRYQ